MGAVEADSANKLRTATSAHLVSTHSAEKHCGNETMSFPSKEFGFHCKNPQFMWRIVKKYIKK